MRFFFVLGLWCLAACGGRPDDPPPPDPPSSGAQSATVAEPEANHASLVQCGHVDALCPSVLSDGAARTACAPGRTVHIADCAPFSVLYVREGADTGERCYYDDAGSLVAAVHYVAVRSTCAYGPVTFMPPECPSDATISNDVCFAPAIE